SRSPACRQIEEESLIVQAQEAVAEQLLLVDQMANVGAREAGARRTGAALLQRRRVARKAGVLEVQPARPGQSRAGSSEPRRQHAVEHVDPALDHLEHALRVADAYEVAGAVARQQRRSPANSLEHQVAVLA